MTRIKSVISLSIILWVCSCIEPFPLSFNGNKVIFTVEATLTDIDEPQKIKLSESNSSEGNNYVLPVLNAKVEILVDKKEKIVLSEQENGIYALPGSFRTKIGSTYQLFIQRVDGSQYQSGVETMIGVSDIVKIYDEFLIKGIPRGAYYDPAHYIYIDTPDPANQKNNYMWTWKLWELQEVCITCLNGRYFDTGTSRDPRGCRKEAGFENIWFDYFCNGDCWDLFFSTELNVFSDIYTNGNVITGKLVAKIPYYQEGGSLIEIQQQSVSPDAYRYFKLIADQVQNNGNLVDTPPSGILGNVKNINNANEPVAGLFMVTSIKKMRYWISRENAKDKAFPVGLLDHFIIPEPTDEAQPERPPLVPCIEGPTRTKIKPDGWIDRIRRVK
ncbi:DUF4249 domain-containing protein [Emticicia sp. BO119]|uniref:DUF4249 domain-containing protein n=1 Tax=Emticicia sp. BO119 TaxID=2757768 RepID=UPI0015F12204|nr:DUF4249 domain-containing protein [Emticicia sp. BO119]MBA4852541.1 DUF4249 domain-containing protein [Emticicia sp. BO119]